MKLSTIDITLYLLEEIIFKKPMIGDFEVLVEYFSKTGFLELLFKRISLDEYII